jgi:aryl-alcohol dehydrogenase-like predicted oxidoreductase
MEYRRLGHSGLQVSVIGLGTNNFQIPSDLVVRYQVIDIVEVIFALIWRGTIV